MTVRRLQIFGLVAGLAVCVMTGTAMASERAAELWFDRASEADVCLDEERLRGEVSARLGYDPFIVDSAARIHVAIEPLEHSEGFSAEIEHFSAPDADPGVRSFEVDDPSCEELTGAIVFAVSVAIDPANALEEAPPESDPPEQPDRADSGDPDPEPIDDPPAPPGPDRESVEKPVVLADSADDDSTSFDLQAAVGGALSVGSAPGPAGGVLFGVEALFEQISLDLRARAEFPRSAPFGQGRIETSLWLGELSPCARLGSVVACIPVALGVQQAQGFDLVNSRSSTVPYVGLGARLGKRWHLRERAGLRIDAAVLTALRRTTVRVGDSAAWQMPALSANGTISFFFEFL